MADFEQLVNLLNKAGAGEEAKVDLTGKASDTDDSVVYHDNPYISQEVAGSFKRNICYKLGNNVTNSMKLMCSLATPDTCHARQGRQKRRSQNLLKLDVFRPPSQEGLQLHE